MKKESLDVEGWTWSTFAIRYGINLLIFCLYILKREILH